MHVHAESFYVVILNSSVSSCSCYVLSELIIAAFSENFCNVLCKVTAIIM